MLTRQRLSEIRPLVIRSAKVPDLIWGFGPIMHLKSYLVDGERLRTGSANFTASGLKQQDNDLVVTRGQGIDRAVQGELRADVGKGESASDRWRHALNSE